MAETISQAAREEIDRVKSGLAELRKKKPTKKVREEIEANEEYIKTLSKPGVYEEILQAEEDIKAGRTVSLDELGEHLDRRRGNVPPE